VFGDADLATLERLLTNEADMAFRRRAVRLLDYLELADGRRVLDCGCGMGFYLLAMSRLRQMELYGVDSDLRRLAQADALGTGAVLAEAGATQLPFPDEWFDAVLLSEVLEHIPDDAAALAEIRRVLRPGGVLAISVPNARYPFLWDPINATWSALGGAPLRRGPLVGIWTNHERLYERTDLERRVSEAGFEVEIVETATHYAFPFMHFIVYGIGKPLLERGLLPQRLHASTDRLAGEANSGSPLNPFNIVRAVFRLVDRLNEQPAARGRTSTVNVLLKGRRPD
jgi:ubiquinone/menaquinone biosynthesis C-methylase UbiE